MSLWNARSIVNKLSSFHSFVYLSPFLIIGLTETWLTQSMFDSEVLPNNFVIFRQDRSSRGGGVLLAIHSSIPCSHLPSPPELEIVALCHLKSLPVIICLVYVSPNASDLYHHLLRQYLSSLLRSSPNPIIIGDFNYPDICWGSTHNSSDLFCDLIFDFKIKLKTKLF